MAETRSISEQLERLRERSGLSLSAVAAAMGKKGASSVQRYFDGSYTKDYLPKPLAEQFCAAFAGKGNPPIQASEIMLLAGLASPDEPLPNVSAVTTFPPLNSMPLDVPIRGTAVGGSAGDFSLNGEIVDYARRPPGIARNSQVFCVFLRGDSMEPRLEPGDLLYVNPARPAKPGDDVLVEMLPTEPGEPGHAYIKRLEGQTPTKLILRQFNPTKRFELPLNRVVRVSPIMRTAELLGF